MPSTVGGRSGCKLTIGGKRTSGAVGSSAAMCLAHGYGKGMNFVKKAGVTCRRIGGEGLSRERNQRFIIAAAGWWRKQPMAHGDAA
jgi:hypothetical protein